jgi:AcrR family transcriptional regulator
VLDVASRAVREAGRGQIGAGKLPGVRGRPAVFTREDILETAKVAFSKAGFANVTLDELAAQLNTGKGTLYYHSNRKVDLLIAITNAMVENNRKELRKIAAVDASPEVRFVLAMRALMQGVLSDGQASKVYFENEADLPPEFRAKLRRRLREIQESFVGIIADGVAAGVFKCEPRIAAKHVLAMCAWPYRWFSHDGKMSLDEFITSAVNFALGGLRAESAARPVRGEPRATKFSKASRRTPPAT